MKLAGRKVDLVRFATTVELQVLHVEDLCHIVHFAMRPIVIALCLGGLAPLCVGSVAASEETVSHSVPVLTNAVQIRELTADEAGKRLPVCLSGAVIDTAIAGPDRHSLILLDPTAGIYVLVLTNVQDMVATFFPGDLLRVEGVTGAGQFAPILIAKTVRKLGTAPVPPATPVTYQQLITGALDAQWVELKGVVRQTIGPAPGSSIVRIVIAADGGLVQARFTMQSNVTVEVDAEVCVRAVCLYQFNQKRQVLTPVLQVPRSESVTILKPAPRDPYAAPVRLAASLLTFSPENLHAYAHRTHVRGVVTFSQPGSFVWIRDGTSGLRVESSQRQSLSPGDEIEVAGFPTFGSNTPELQDAIFRKAGSTRPPVPILLTNLNEAFDHEDDLVAVEGQLTQIQPILNGITYTLDNNGQIFKAVLKMSSGEQADPDWQTGARVRITGICNVVHDDNRPFAGMWQPKSFEILLRTPADLRILQPPSWWTLAHQAMLLGIATGVLTLVIGMVVLLSRKRLREQAARRAMAETEFSAIFAERNRIAREIHDTLAQGLGGISIQLECVRSSLKDPPGDVSRHLDLARTLVRGSLTDARRAIWEMRSQALENGDLAAALEEVLKQLTDGLAVEARFQTAGQSRRLAPLAENALLHLGQEALTNAVTHAHAKRIEARLEFGEKHVRLFVKDDGCGFNPGEPSRNGGGFGLLGMRERVERLHGELLVTSSPGSGTEISVTIPAPLNLRAPQPV
jgi:signal transduction histidine kinase